MTVQTYDDPEAISGIGWNELVRADAAPVFYQTGYLTAYSRSPLAVVDRFSYLVVRQAPAERPVAVVPVALHREADPLGGLRGIHPGVEHGPALLSHVWHCYDTRIVGLAALGEAGTDVAAVVVQALADLADRWGARWFGFVNVERGSATAAALTAAGLAGTHLVDRFRADLTGLTSFEGYLRRLGTRPRANLTRCARRAAEVGISTSITGAADCDLDEVAELCGRSAARFGNPGFYPTQTFASFVAGLGPLAHVLAVRQSGRLVAVGVCLTDERRFHTWTCGVDYDVVGNASPYTLLFAESVALAIRLGLPVLEGGRSNAVFKTRHGLAPCRLDAHLAKT
ncbi:MAG TPA: GNAT family N-acetyltransferase [Streptosporangiaceae bacterium]|nr:GNAT family N-acetyltransferase [Streptosporangiaceae bacterium]